MNMLLTLSLSIVCGVVTGCMEPPQVIAVADDEKRSQAKSVLEVVTEANISKSNIGGVADCLVASASDPEIVSLAGASFTGITQKTVEMGLGIADRPAAMSCIEGLGLTRLADG